METLKGSNRKNGRDLAASRATTRRPAVLYYFRLGLVSAAAAELGLAVFAFQIQRVCVESSNSHGG